MMMVNEKNDWAAVGRQQRADEREVGGRTM
jgi:hypothetical protein